MSTCSGCRCFIKSTSIALSGTTLQITIPSVPIQNGQRLCVALCQTIPGTVTPNTLVQLISGNAKLPLINCCGNYLYADQLRARRVLKVQVATDVPQGIVLRDSAVCATQHVFPTINSTPTTATQATAATK